MTKSVSLHYFCMGWGFSSEHSPDLTEWIGPHTIWFLDGPFSFPKKGDLDFQCPGRDTYKSETRTLFDFQVLISGTVS